MIIDRFDPNETYTYTITIRANIEEDARFDNNQICNQAGFEVE